MTTSAIYITLYTLAILGILMIAALVYLRRKGAEYVWFSVFSLLIALWLGLQFLAQIFHSSHLFDPNLMVKVTIAIGPFFAVAFYFFTTHYVGKSTRHIVHFIVPSLLAVVGLATDLTVIEATSTEAGIAILEVGPLYLVVLLSLLAYIIGGIVRIVRELISKKGKVSPSRRRAGVILIAGMAQAVLLILVPSVFFTEYVENQILIPVSLLFMVAIFSYAVVKHKLFDIRFVIVRALAYLMSLLLVGSAYFATVLFFVSYFLASSELSALQPFIYTIAALLLALTFAPLKKFFDRITRRLFYRDAYESQDVIDRLSTVLVRTADLEEMLDTSLEIVRSSLRLEHVTFVFPERRKDHRDEIYRGVGKLPPATIVTQKTLQDFTDKLLLQDEIEDQTGRRAQYLQAINAAAVLRLETRGELIGFILLGYKVSGAAYSIQDTALLRIVADELALAIQNALRFEEIRDFNKTLQARIDEATAQLRRSNAKLQQLDEAKDDFISMASHQLRTPLTSVKGYLSMVLEGDAGDMKPAQRKLLEEAYAGAQRMVYLIGDFLNVSRMKTGKFTLEYANTNLAEIINEEIDQLRATAERRNLHLLYEAPEDFPTVRLDETKMRQVIMNLIDNAIYYSRPGGTIKVELFTRDAQLVFRVKDEGIGVPAAQQKDLFEKFFRASNARKVRPDGTGIGLFMIKKVVLAHGGSIIFSSTEGKGSTFGFAVPVSRQIKAAKK